MLYMTFSVWLRSGSYPADINWFGSHKEQLFIASYYRQLSADIKMKNYKIKTSFQAGANKTGTNFMVRGKIFQFDVIHDFSLQLRTGSYPEDINWFGSHKEQLFIAAYYRQLSADIKMENYKIKTSFVGPEGPKACAKKADIILYDFYFSNHGKMSVI